MITATTPFGDDVLLNNPNYKELAARTAERVPPRQSPRLQSESPMVARGWLPVQITLDRAVRTRLRLPGRWLVTVPRKAENLKIDPFAQWGQAARRGYYSVGALRPVTLAASANGQCGPAAASPRRMPTRMRARRGAH